jgi:hypothetical protein
MHAAHQRLCGDFGLLAESERQFQICFPFMGEASFVEIAAGRDEWKY